MKFKKSRWIRKTRRGRKNRPRKRLWKRKSRVRPVKNKTWKLKGIKHKLDNRAELKWTVYTNDIRYALPAVLNQPIVIWGNNDRDGSSVPFITPPTTGLSQSQYIGTKINALYADVRFMGRIYFDVVHPNEQIRIMVVRSRLGGQDGTNYGTLPTRILEPIDAKQWDIMYDKVTAMTTGIQQNVTIGGTNYSIANLFMPSKMWRFKIPLRETIQQKNGRLIWEYPIIICGLSQYANFSITHCFFKFYYRDP